MFRYVTLPALRPAITIVLILSIINSLKAFDIVYGMTGGGPAQSTQMLALWAFTQADRNRKLYIFLLQRERSFGMRITRSIHLRPSGDRSRSAKRSS